jgi:hypothetical protein
LHGEARLQGGERRNDLPRTVAIATNPAGTGAHAWRWTSSVASKTTGIALKVQPYNGPNAWMPLLESGELELGVLNILDSQMAATGTGNYKKPYPMLRVIAGGVFPFTASAMVRDKSDIKQISDLKGKRMAGLQRQNRSRRHSSRGLNRRDCQATCSRSESPTSTTAFARCPKERSMRHGHPSAPAPTKRRMP